MIYKVQLLVSADDYWNGREKKNSPAEGRPKKDEDQHEET